MKASKTTEGDIELLVRATENIRFPNGPSIDTLLFSQNKQTFLAKVLSATYSPSEITLTCSDEILSSIAVTRVCTEVLLRYFSRDRQIRTFSSTRGYIGRHTGGATAKMER